MVGILIDADLILEALMNRTQLIEDISEILDKVNPLIKMYVTDVGWQKIYNYASRFQNSQVAQVIIDWLQEKFTICKIDKNILQQARYSSIQDFESAVEFACASYQEFDAILTHRHEDFSAAPKKFSIWSVADLRVRTYLENQFQITSKFK